MNGIRVDGAIEGPRTPRQPMSDRATVEAKIEETDHPRVRAPTHGHTLGEHRIWPGDVLVGRDAKLVLDVVNENAVVYNIDADRYGVYWEQHIDEDIERGDVVAYAEVIEPPEEPVR